MSQPSDMLKDGQLAKSIYIRNMAAMKDLLELGEFKIGKRESDEYKYYKKKVMDAFYESMLDTFELLCQKGVLMKCLCGTTIRKGYKPCPKCGGAGYCNAQIYDDFLSNQP